MGEFFTALAGLAGTHPLIFLIVVLVLALVAAPYLRKLARENGIVADEGEAIRKAGDQIRAELGSMLDKEQLRVEALAVSLDSARIEVGRMHGENAILRADMSALRAEMKSLFRTARAMRMAMKRALADNDVLPLKIWLDLNPDDEDPVTPEPAK